MTDMLISTGTLLAALRGIGEAIDVSQLYARTIMNYPSRRVDTSEALVMLPVTVDDEVKVSHSFAMAVVRGVPEWPQCSAWTFTMDGHDYYVLNTMNETLVCDLSADPPAWYVWGTGDDVKWRGWVGKQWVAKLPIEEGFGSNILVGDKALGTLYFLGPQTPADDPADFDLVEPVPFRRVVTGQIMVRGRSYVDCPGVEVTGSAPQLYDDTLTAVELLSSDDRGESYTSHGTLNVVPGDFDQRLDWYSLGSMASPGRLFQVVDYGALTRVDDLEMPEND